MSIDLVMEFSVLPLPRILFGTNRVARLASALSAYGRNLLLVTGRRTLQRRPFPPDFVEGLRKSSFNCTVLEVDREPSPELIDHASSLGRQTHFDVVVAIGGGSVMDAGKAISAMLFQHHSVERFIEGQEGMLLHDGRKAPFVAIPTTSGTGSEVTSNAVISSVGKGGYKRSLRHPAFVPDMAIIDPELMVTMPPEVTASTGMDAFTQLLEAFLSPFSSPFTDALCISGLERFSRSFEAGCGEGSGDLSVRADLAYAALMSGIALANAGLGIVHGFASSVGGFFDIPHGTLCATLLAESTRENIRQLRLSDADWPALQKFARAGRILAGEVASDDREACDLLVGRLELLQQRFAFPRLGAYGVRESDFDAIIAVTRSRSNAVPLDEESMRRILASRV